MAGFRDQAFGFGEDVPKIFSQTGILDAGASVAYPVRVAGVRRIGDLSARAAGFAAALLAAVLTPHSTAVATEVERLADASADKVLTSTVIPDAVRKVGEVRLITRGDAVVVQTLLSTKLLSRVIAEIRRKEIANWPPEDASVAAYAAALDAARATVEKREPKVAKGDRRRRLLIEFAADADDAKVMVGTFRVAKDGSDTTPHDREVFETLALPRAYVLRNMRLILADSFEIAEPDVDRLGPLGPAAAQSKATQPVAPGEPAPSAPAVGN